MAFKDKFKAKFNESPFKNGWPRISVTKTGGGPNRKRILPSVDISFNKRDKNKRNKNNDRKSGGAILQGTVY